MLLLVFWGGLALCAYTYAGYLLSLVVLDAVGSLRSSSRYLSGGSDRRHSGGADRWPTISVLIAAFNEESCIRQKIENTLALEYPLERLEIWIGSDGSSDRTEDIVREYAARGVKLSSAPRAGKASVLNRLARGATGRFWLFTDANTRIAPDALRLLVARTGDADVGAICGRLRLLSPQGIQEEGAYWKYENLLKYYESKRGSVMGANGGLYLLRREEWQTLPADAIVDDFLVTMRIVLHGRRVLYAPEAVAFEETAPDLNGEFVRRVRISAGNFQALRELRPFLTRLDFTGFAFWSHKVLRWCVPLLLVSTFAANVALAARPFFAVTLLLQLAFYLAALAASTRLGRSLRGPALARYFVEMNAAIAFGFFRWLRGAQTVTWHRTVRTASAR